MRASADMSRHTTETCTWTDIRKALKQLSKFGIMNLSMCTLQMRENIMCQNTCNWCDVPPSDLQPSKQPHTNECVDEVDDEYDDQHTQGEHKHIRQNPSNLLHTLPVPLSSNGTLIHTYSHTQKVNNSRCVVAWNECYYTYFCI